MRKLIGRFIWWALKDHEIKISADFSGNGFSRCASLPQHIVAMLQSSEFNNHLYNGHERRIHSIEAIVRPEVLLPMKAELPATEQPKAVKKTKPKAKVAGRAKR